MGEGVRRRERERETETEMGKENKMNWKKSRLIGVLWFVDGAMIINKHQHQLQTDTAERRTDMQRKSYKFEQKKKKKKEYALQTRTKPITNESSIWSSVFFFNSLFARLVLWWKTTTKILYCLATHPYLYINFTDFCFFVFIFRSLAKPYNLTTSTTLDREWNVPFRAGDYFFYFSALLLFAFRFASIHKIFSDFYCIMYDIRRLNGKSSHVCEQSDRCAAFIRIETWIGSIALNENYFLQMKKKKKRIGKKWWLILVKCCIYNFQCKVIVFISSYSSTGWHWTIVNWFLNSSQIRICWFSFSFVSTLYNINSSIVHDNTRYTILMTPCGRNPID